MGHISHYNKWIHEDYIYRVYYNNVDADTNKVCPSVRDTYGLQLCIQFQTPVFDFDKNHLKLSIRVLEILLY